MEEAVWNAWKRKLEETERNFDAAEGLISETVNGINYHTSVSAGKVHRTLANAEYAAALYEKDTPESRVLAEKILRRLLAEQDRNPQDETFGVWPYLFEEPFSRMKNPDWNWAAFVGRTLITILAEFGAKIPEELSQAIGEALEAACESILRRNMAVDYTNISLMTSFVLVKTGELFAQEKYFIRGVETLRRQQEFLAKNGGYAEYNSPYYGVVDLEETGRMLRYFRSPEALGLARSLHNAAWKVFAEHYHSPTRQIAPPHARCYADVQDMRIPTLIRMGTHGACRAAEDGELDVALLWIFITFDCPQEYFAAFGPLKEPREEEHVFYRGWDPIPDSQTRILLEKGMPQLSAYTYLTPEYCLGSFAGHDLWNQRRPLMAYFRTAEGTVCFRARCLHDGMDFSSAVMVNAQKKNAVCGGISFVTDHGDYHYILTPLKNGTITADHFDVNFTVTGAVNGVTVTPAGRGEYHFAAGGLLLRLRILAACFDGRGVKAVPLNADGEKGISLPLYSGRQGTIDFRSLKDSFVLYSLDVVSSGDAPAPEVRVSTDETKVLLSLTKDGVLQTTAPVARRPVRYLPPMPGLEKRFRKGGFYYVHSENTEKNRP